jgi:hypothetical protein
MNADVVERARKDKSRAMDARDLGDWDEALGILDGARNNLTSALADLARQPGDEKTNLRAFETAIKKQLYQLLGSIGGVYRRRARSADRQPEDLDKAIDFYDEGFVVEQEFTDSYNLVQRLVTRVLRQPGAALDDAAAVKGVGVRTALRAAQAILKGQTSSSGSRSSDEYAFADLLLVAVLVGDQDWKQAVQDFTRQSSPSSYARMVTVDVLQELVDRLAGEHAAVSFGERAAAALRLVAS